MKYSKTVEEYLAKHDNWKEELKLLRKLILSTGLEETIKWGAPVYTINNKNVVGIGAFKSYVGLWFFQGALLKDTEGFLVNAQEGKTKALRQWRFKHKEDIDETLVNKYLLEAIRNQKAGKELKPSRNKEITIPTELQQAFSESATLKTCFDSLSPGKKREYAEYIMEAKRHATKSTRIEKIVPLIMEKKGLNDKYRK